MQNWTDKWCDMALPTRKEEELPKIADRQEPCSRPWQYRPGTSAIPKWTKEVSVIHFSLSPFLFVCLFFFGGGGGGGSFLKLFLLGGGVVGDVQTYTNFAPDSSSSGPAPQPSPSGRRRSASFIYHSHPFCCLFVVVVWGAGGGG